MLSFRTSVLQGREHVSSSTARNSRTTRCNAHGQLRSGEVGGRR